MHILVEYVTIHIKIIVFKAEGQYDLVKYGLKYVDFSTEYVGLFIYLMYFSHTFLFVLLLFCFVFVFILPPVLKEPS